MICNHRRTRPASPVPLRTVLNLTKKMDNEGTFKPLEHIEQIAKLLRSLTYGETVELVSELRKGGDTKQLDRLAELIRSATYGEMLELASELQKAAGEPEITADTLPKILHRWASEYGK
jgi:hypothetical protein